MSVDILPVMGICSDEKGNIMRIQIFSVLLALAMTACGGQSDSTMNRPDSDGDLSGYPAGPYGYNVGSIMQNIDFVGKVPAADTTASPTLYDQIDMQPVSLLDYHKNPAVKHLMIVAVARWCPPCNDEQPSVRSLATKYASKGVQVIEMLAEGSTRGVPATDSDIDKWADSWGSGGSEGFQGGPHGLTIPVFLDPNDRMGVYADKSAYPLGMAVRTDTMAIEYMCVGGAGTAGCDHDAALAQLVE
jgi:thiol-disulfide isomerase/thioredoxin